eukprot:TRINITY_DN2770_c3_g1_i1.p2 TRINITY_DN2770_c3_g1~~TRINITY_DN2770_c3_g1_i1.p2  ORF type:complete len:114 (+),score=7.20 TRINITY_DN2770_c3_g1_i1:49-342(+)
MTVSKRGAPAGNDSILVPARPSADNSPSKQISWDEGNLASHASAPGGRRITVVDLPPPPRVPSPIADEDLSPPALPPCRLVVGETAESPPSRKRRTM